MEIEEGVQPRSRAVELPVGGRKDVVENDEAAWRSTIVVVTTLWWKAFWRM
jgi:hypothetical protein